MSAHPITSVRTYVLVFVGLIIGTVLTYYAALVDVGWMNTPLALAIAFTKASLVVVFFMGVRYNTPLTKVVVFSGLLWLGIMFTLTMGDYLTRTWVGVPGR
jgi:cytochrome c oxidase subunit IV